MNACQQNTGLDDLMWSRSSMDLNGICQAGMIFWNTLRIILLNL